MPVSYLTALRRLSAGGLAAGCLLLASLPVNAHAEARLALVIGNAKYTGSELPNPGNDARAVAASFSGLGFRVFEVYDGSLTQMETALSNFSRAIQPGDTAVIFYAGHGVQGTAPRPEDGIDNYLVPVDAEFATAERVPVEALALTSVLERLDRAQAGSRIVILDACRNNPFARRWRTGGRSVGAVSSGLAQPTSAVLRGVYIAFATSPGDEAADSAGEDTAHSPFTQELLERIGRPGQSVNSMFEEVSEAVEGLTKGQQIPWFSGSGTAARVMFKPGAAVQPAPEPKRAVSAPLPPEYAQLPPRAQQFLAEHQLDARGQYRIGLRFHEGTDEFPQDLGQALVWFRKAAAQGYREAPIMVAAAYMPRSPRQYPGVAKDETEARRWMERAADVGDPLAFTGLGSMYWRGEGGLRADRTKAVELFRRGVEGGDDTAMTWMGRAYEDGWPGTATDLAQARSWYQKAAALGSEAANRALARLDGKAP